MSSQRETWITIKNGNIVEHSENDGYALMRKGFQEHDEIIMSVCEESEYDWKKQLIARNEL